MKFNAELNDFFKTEFLKYSDIFYEYHVIITALYINGIYINNIVPFRDDAPLASILCIGILIYIVIPQIYLYLLKRSVLKNSFQIRENKFYINNISFETFKEGRVIYCKEYDSVIFMGIKTPRLICRYKLRVFAIPKSNLDEGNKKALSEFYTEVFTERKDTNYFY